MSKENSEELIGLALANKVKFSCCGLKITEKYYLLGLFTVCNAFLFADQNLLAPNLSVIQEEFNFTDNERDQYLGGYISLGFFAIGGTVSMITGFLADRVNRKMVFTITVLIGEISCAATYFVPTNTLRDYWTGLWLTRSITGVALGGAIPIQFSLLGDLFTEDTRGMAVSLFTVAYGSGIAFGQALAGILSPDFRTPFLIVSLPSILILALFVFTTTEPRRGQAEQELQDRVSILAQDHTLTWAKFKAMFSVPTVALTILQGLPGTLPWGVVSIFLNDFLLEEGEQSTGSATTALLVFGLAAGISTLVGGYSFDKFLNTNPRLLPFLCGITTFVAPLSLVIVLRHAETTSGGIISALMLLTGALAGFAGTVIKGILLHVALPETRGTAFAFQSLLDDLGKGLGPFSISLIISASSNREDGLVIGALAWFPTALVMFAISFFIVDDIEKSRAALREAYGIEGGDLVGSMEIDSTADKKDNKSISDDEDIPTYTL